MLQSENESTLIYVSNYNNNLAVSALYHDKGHAENQFFFFSELDGWTSIKVFAPSRRRPRDKLDYRIASLAAVKFEIVTSECTVSK